MRLAKRIFTSTAAILTVAALSVSSVAVPPDDNSGITGKTKTAVYQNIFDLTDDNVSGEWQVISIDDSNSSVINFNYKNAILTVNNDGTAVWKFANFDNDFTALIVKISDFDNTVYAVSQGYYYPKDGTVKAVSITGGTFKVDLYDKIMTFTDSYGCVVTLEKQLKKEAKND